MNPIDKVIERIRGSGLKVKQQGKGYMCCCPAHPEKTPSLSIKQADNGKVLVHCFAGCSTKDVMAAIGMEMRELFADSLTPEERLRYEREKLEERRQYLEILLSIASNPTVSLSADDIEVATAAKEELDAIDAKTRESYQPVSLVGFMGAQQQLANFVVSEWFPRRVVTLLGGHGGTGKSSFALMMAACIACGRNIADREVKQGKVLFLSLEDEASVVLFRLQCIVNQLGLDPAVIEKSMTVLDGTSCGMTALFMEGSRKEEPYLTKHYSELVEASRGHDAIFVDNSSDAYMADENNRRQVRMFMAALARLAREYNAAVVLLAHIDKAAARYGAEGNSYSGSTAWHNSSRSRLALLDASDCLKIIHEKHNYSKQAADVLLEFRGGVVMPAPQGYVPSDPALAMFDAAEVLEVMTQMQERGEQIPAAIGGPSNMYIAMHPWFSDGGIADNQKTYKKRLLKAVLTLEGQNRIKKEAKLLSKNNKRDFWVVG